MRQIYHDFLEHGQLVLPENDDVTLHAFVGCFALIVVLAICAGESVLDQVKRCAAAGLRAALPAIAVQSRAGAVCSPSSSCMFSVWEALQLIEDADIIDYKGVTQGSLSIKLIVVPSALEKLPEKDLDLLFTCALAAIPRLMMAERESIVGRRTLGNLAGRISISGANNSVTV